MNLGNVSRIIRASCAVHLQCVAGQIPPVQASEDWLLRIRLIQSRGREILRKNASQQIRLMSGGNAKKQIVSFML